MFHKLFGLGGIAAFKNYLYIARMFVAQVVVVPQLSEDSAKLLLGQNGFIWVALTASMAEPLAARRHQSRTEALVLPEHSLIGGTDKIEILLRLAVYGIAFPPDYLVGLPSGDGHFAGLPALHRTYLTLLVGIPVFQRLEKTLHALADYPVEPESVAVQIRQYIGRIFVPRPYIHRTSAPYEPLYVQSSEHMISVFE